jgi:hypothetical protein
VALVVLLVAQVLY